jgi:hypothetical protein
VPQADGHLLHQARLHHTDGPIFSGGWYDLTQHRIDHHGWQLLHALLQAGDARLGGMVSK